MHLYSECLAALFTGALAALVAVVPPVLEDAAAPDVGTAKLPVVAVVFPAAPVAANPKPGAAAFESPPAALLSALGADENPKDAAGAFASAPAAGAAPPAEEKPNPDVPVPAGFTSSFAADAALLV